MEQMSDISGEELGSQRLGDGPVNVIGEEVLPEGVIDGENLLPTPEPDVILLPKLEEQLKHR